MRFCKGPVNVYLLKGRPDMTREKLAQAGQLPKEKVKRLFPSGLRYKRSLRVGSQGMAALFQVAVKHVVAKWAFPGPGRTMRDEKTVAEV